MVLSCDVRGNGVCSVAHCISIVIERVLTHEGLDEISVGNEMLHVERIQACFFSYRGSYDFREVVDVLIVLDKDFVHFTIEVGESKNVGRELSVVLQDCTDASLLQA